MSVRLVAAIAALGVSMIMSGCSSVRAAGGAEAKDLSVLDIGTNRYDVVAELGKPVLTEEVDGRLVDVFAFKQGQVRAAKAGRSLFYGLAAVGTLGLSEVVTNPIEGAVGEGADIQLKVEYEDGRVDRLQVLRDDRWVRIQDIEEPVELPEPEGTADE